MKRTLFSEQHEMLRDAFRQFVRAEVVPNQDRWREEGMVDRELWRKAGRAGFLCPWVEEEYGGPGGDFLHSVVLAEELSYAYESGFALTLHSDIVVPYIHEYGTEEQKKYWLPKCCSGEVVTALGMTEPNTGSDVSGIATRAVEDGDDYVINGSKTFITNGIISDVVILAVKTGEPDDDPHSSITMVIVEADRPGFKRGRKLDKIGMHAQDTAELHFEDCRVPKSNVLGEVGGGFYMMMRMLQQERLTVAIQSQALARQVVEDTTTYTQERKAFGRPISKFQNTQFKLVECATKVEVGQAFLDKLVAQHVAGEYLVKECSMAKIWQTEMADEVIDTCLQLYGGYGYMMEYPIARAYVDSRVSRIYAGTNEIMKVIVAKQMGL